MGVQHVHNNLFYRMVSASPIFRIVFRKIMALVLNARFPTFYKITSVLSLFLFANNMMQ